MLFRSKSEIVKVDNRFSKKLKRRNYRILNWNKNANLYIVELIDNTSSITSQGKVLKKIMDNYGDDKNVGCKCDHDIAE